MCLVFASLFAIAFADVFLFVVRHAVGMAVCAVAFVTVGFGRVVRLIVHLLGCLYLLLFCSFVRPCVRSCARLVVCPLL